MFGLFKRSRKANTADSRSRKVKFNIKIPERRFLAIGDETPKSVALSPINYRGRFLRKENDVILIGICVSKDSKLIYNKGNIIGVSFGSEMNKTVEISKSNVYNFSAVILNIRAVEDRDEFTFETIGDILIETGTKIETIETRAEIDNCELYVFEIKAVSRLTEHSNREFFRCDVSVPVYYKPDCDDDIGESLDKGDMSKGYIRMDTVNMSAGGFKCESRRYVEPGKILECRIAMGYEVLPISLKILDTQLIEKSEESPHDLYLLRVIFFELAEDIRDRLIMHIFNYQQREQKFQQKIGRFQKEFHERKLKS